MGLTSKDITLEPSHVEEALKYLKEAFENCQVSGVGPWEVWYAFHIAGMIHAETGMQTGLSRTELQMVKKVAQVDFMKHHTKRPDLWQPKK